MPKFRQICREKVTSTQTYINTYASSYRYNACFLQVLGMIRRNSHFDVLIQKDVDFIFTTRVMTRCRGAQESRTTDHFTIDIEIQ